MEVVASLSQGRTAAAQCGLFTHKSVPFIFEPPCSLFTNSTAYAASVHMGFLVDEVALVEVFLRVFMLSLVSVILVMLHSRLLPIYT